MVNCPRSILTNSVVGDDDDDVVEGVMSWTRSFGGLWW